MFLWHFFWYKRLGFKLRVTIYPNTIDAGLRIYHVGDLIQVGPNVKIGRNCTILPGVVFGNKSEKQDDGCVMVGDNCYFGLGAKIFGSVTIGNNVILGANVIIIGDVYIGDNVIIGAGCVVTKDIPDNCVVVGNPMRIIRK